MCNPLYHFTWCSFADHLRNLWHNGISPRTSIPLETITIKLKRCMEKTCEKDGKKTSSCPDHLLIISSSAWRKVGIREYSQCFSRFHGAKLIVYCGALKSSMFKWIWAGTDKEKESNLSFSQLWIKYNNCWNVSEKDSPLATNRRIYFDNGKFGNNWPSGIVPKGIRKLKKQIDLTTPIGQRK